METDQLKKSVPSQSEVRELFDYDPATGILHWRKYKNKSVTCTNTADYVVVRTLGKLYYAHHIIWIWQYGVLPEQIDHIDRDRSNNRLSNLRACTQEQNSGNVSKKAGCSSKWKGVTWFKRDSCWKAQIGVKGRNYALGYFKCEDEAAMAYNLEAEKHFGEFALLNRAIQPDYPLNET